MPSTQDTSDQSKTVSDKTPGVVYLVGAGPGHPGLITRWGYELLQRCDAVAYDALIPMELIAELPEKVESGNALESIRFPNLKSTSCWCRWRGVV